LIRQDGRRMPHRARAATTCAGRKPIDLFLHGRFTGMR
jgi:hypothetical protein